MAALSFGFTQAAKATIAASRLSVYSFIMKTYQKKTSKDVTATTFRFDPDLYEEMQAAAKARRCSLSLLAHDALRSFLHVDATSPVSVISAIVASNRNPYVTITAKIDKTQSYHGIVDSKEWEKSKDKGLVPFFLTFEDLDRKIFPDTKYDIPLALVTSVVEDEDGVVHKRNCAKQPNEIIRFGDKVGTFDVNQVIIDKLGTIYMEERFIQTYKEIEENATSPERLKSYLTAKYVKDGFTGQLLYDITGTRSGRLSKPAAKVLMGVFVPFKFCYEDDSVIPGIFYGVLAGKRGNYYEVRFTTRNILEGITEEDVIKEISSHPSRVVD